jgi:AcrR family transcriptional regulator
VGSDKRSEILDAAIDLFSRKGFEGTSMRDLAVAVRLQPGSLYTHITGKDELLAMVEGRVRAQFLETAKPLLADTSMPVPERLAAFLRRHLAIIAENLASATVFLHEWKFLEPTQLAISRKERRAYSDAVTAVIEEGIRNGDFRDVDARVTAQALLAMANGTYLWYSPDGRLPATTIADRFVDLVLHGLAASPRPTRPRKAAAR